MSRRDLPVVGALLLLCACGGPEVGVDIQMSMSPLIAPEAVRATVSLYNAPVSCEVVRLSPTRDGIYNSQVTLAGGAASTELFEIVPGRYQVAVFVFDASDEVIGFGCDPREVEVEQGRRAELGPITVDPV